MTLPDPTHFRCEIAGGIARIAHDRPECKNPLSFDSCAEMRDWFRALVYADDVHAVVILPNGGNFSSGGDVHDIIGPLTAMSMKELLAFTRMTGDLVKAMVHCGKPIIAAVDGVCAGAGAIMAMASDMRIAGPDAKVAFLFNRVGLAGCDIGGLRDASPDRGAGPCARNTGPPRGAGGFRIFHAGPRDRRAHALRDARTVGWMAAKKPAQARRYPPSR
jgi:hypothetical protein